MSWPDPIESATWFPIECRGELARDIREHNARVARDIADAAARRNAVLLASQSFLDVVTSSPSKAPDESDAEYRRRHVRELAEFDAGPSECLPVATETKSPARDYCAELRAQLATVGATVTLSKRLQDLDGWRVAPGYSIKAGQAVSVDAAGLIRPISAPRAVSSVAQLAAQDAARCHDGSWSTTPPTREDKRRAIDALLREDARRTPAFATARRAAVLAAADDLDMKAHDAPVVDYAWGTSWVMDITDAKMMLDACHWYESKRGGMAAASSMAIEYKDSWKGPAAIGLAAYERARGMR